MKLDVNESQEANIIRIQKNLIMMDFDIEMINKVILYFNIESEDQAIDYLTKNSDGLWKHPFIEKINDNNNNDETKDNNQIIKNNSLIKGMTTKITEFRNRGISNVIYDSFINEPQMISGNSSDSNSICEICGEPESLHLESTNHNDEIAILENDFNNEIKENNIKNNEINEKEETNINNNENDINININNNNNIDNNNNDQIDNSNCPICLEELENPIEIPTCHHKYCRECFTEYLLDLIKSKKIEKIPCPTKNCFEKELKEEFFSQYLSEEDYFKFRTIRSQIEILKDPKKMFCPFCDSYASIPTNEKIILDPNDSKYVKTTMKCKNGHEFCSCGIALHEGDCYKDSNDFQKFLINENVKQCPKCGFYIKKVNGCNHMTCGNAACRFEFCWLCMQEAVPGHFEFGKCKGMQFINTSSCIYKLKLRHPFIYRIYQLIMSSILLIILTLFPSIISILVSLILIIEHVTVFKNACGKVLYALSVTAILFAFNNIGHCIIAIFLLLLAISLCLKTLFLCCKILKKCISILSGDQA